ncbi:Gfo/Idh/MocA family oxidoreductase [Aeromicrobium sp.]|uniref:Gfo/Idh/MocA family oxidoreductase n=1 Tax=Aeromicrobium sp. TaxID=1871063 RepID=UPI0019AE169C|nr:Gfo/Idh/MocA family oxidoreductase [Aeromicrobium sp.]MBC7632058.1 Gfo/Idh/MocA family oxidoreductase [Aeromicrobium sp.]
MSLRVGVIGAGAMGADHIRTIATSIPAARVAEVYDFDVDRAYAIAQPVFANVATSAEALIDSSAVDAVLICSPDDTHAALVRACIAAGKHVLCEKPLAVTADDSMSVVEAEVAAGRQMVQLGFMRRYDPGYREMRKTLRDGQIGTARLVHCLHRNVSSQTSSTSEGIVTGSMVHELDIVGWLLDDEVDSIRVESPVAEGLRDPQLATIWMRSGVIVSAEVFVNAAYGYDVRCEVVGTSGTVSLVPPTPTSIRRAGMDGVHVRDDFIGRFADAYRLELGAWAEDALNGVVHGPSAWDGYVANVIAEAGVASLTSGVREPVTLAPRPTLYSPIEYS